MRNLKKVFAAIIIVTMVLSTMMVSVFADEVTTPEEDIVTVEKTAAEICKDLGVLKGGSNGVDSQYLATATQRIQAAIIYLRMLGLEDEARAFEGTDNFNDASLVANVPGATNILAYLKANPDLGWVGDGKIFSPIEQVSAQHLYKVMLTILGYEQGADFDYNETLYFAKFIGMNKIANISKLTNADLATALVEALGTPLKGGGPKDTLVSKLVNEGLISEEAAEDNGFEVNVNKIVSVEAPAAIEVVFGTTDLGLPSTVKATLTDGSAMDADVTWDMTGYDANKAGKVTIKGAVEGFEAGVTVDVAVKAFVLDIVSIDVPNARQMVVNYNGTVTGDAVKTAANYVINGNAVADASLSVDGKSVTLTTAAANFMSNYSTNNKLVISKNVGLSADKTIENLAVRDTAVPTMVSAEATGPRTIKVTFSEPIDSATASADTAIERAASFSLDDGKIGLNSASASFNTTDTVLTLSTLADMTEGAHTIKVTGSNLKDGAAYPVASNTLTFNYAKDTSPLTATVTSATENTVKIKFNKAIKAGTFATNANVKLTHTYNTPLNEVTGAAVSTTDDQEFTVTFAKPLPPGTSTVWLSYPDGTLDANKIQDGYGNVFAAASFQVTVTADVTAPTVTAEFTDATHIKVTFSEDVDVTAGTNGALNTANYTLKNGTDTISIIGAARDGGTSTKIINLTTGTINGGTLTLTVKNIKDIAVAQNQIVETALTIAATDKVTPDLDATPFVQISATKIRVNFTEAIDASTLTDKNNYTVSGSALGANDTVTAINGNKSAVITFESAPATGSTVVVGRVKDVAGNWSTWLSKTVGTTKSSFDTIAQSAAELIGASKIKVTVDDQLATTGTVADYVYSIDGGANWFNVTGIASFTVDAANNKTYIELNIGYDAANDTALTTPILVATTDGTTAGNASANVKNGQDQTLKIAAATCTDKYAPKYLSVATGAISSGRLNTVVLTFSEHLYLASVQDSDFTVAGFEVSGIAVDNNADGKAYVTVTLKDKDNSSTEKPKVTLTGSVEDANRNVLAGSVEQTCP